MLSKAEIKQYISTNEISKRLNLDKIGTATWIEKYQVKPKAKKAVGDMFIMLYDRKTTVKAIDDYLCDKKVSTFVDASGLLVIGKPTPPSLAAAAPAPAPTASLNIKELAKELSLELQAQLQPVFDQIALLLRNQNELLDHVTQPNNAAVELSKDLGSH